MFEVPTFHLFLLYILYIYVCVCVCVCVYARACMCVCVCVCVFYSCLRRISLVTLFFIDLQENKVFKIQLTHFFSLSLFLSLSLSLSPLSPLFTHTHMCADTHINTEAHSLTHTHTHIHAHTYTVKFLQKHFRWDQRSDKITAFDLCNNALFEVYLVKTKVSLEDVKMYLTIFLYWMNQNEIADTNRQC